jgi:hypothetical protein
MEYDGFSDRYAEEEDPLTPKPFPRHPMLSRSKARTLTAEDLGIAVQEDPKTPDGGSPVVRFRATHLFDSLRTRGDSLGLIAKRDLGRYYELLAYECATFSDLGYDEWLAIERAAQIWLDGNTHDPLALRMEVECEAPAPLKAKLAAWSRGTWWALADELETQRRVELKELTA